MEEQPERRFGQGDLLSRLRPDLSGGLAAGLFSGLPTFIELPMTRSNTIVLVVDDKPAVAELLKFSLHEDEWIWHSVPSLAQAWDFIGRERPELLLQESMLRQEGGMRLLAHLWETPDTLDQRTVDVHVLRLRKALNRGGKPDLFRDIKDE